MKTAAGEVAEIIGHTIRVLAEIALAAFILYGLYHLMIFPGHLNQ